MNNWTAWVGVKFGTLTVEKYLGYQDRGSAYFLVRCDCGKTKKVTIWEFKKGKEKSCGLLRCKAKVKGLTGTPKPPETITQQDETASALEARLKPKYYCRAVTPDCVISTLLHICCCECDRPCSGVRIRRRSAERGRERNAIRRFFRRNRRYSLRLRASRA